MKTLHELQMSLEQIETHLRYQFQDKTLLTLAFTHRSFVNEHPEELCEDNQRLEFLGDSVLGLVAADFLYRFLPEEPEGKLSPLKASLVEAQACVEYLRKLDLEPFLLLGKGERLSEGRGRESLLADLFEAIVGAVYLDGGYLVAREFILSHIADIMEEIIYKPSQNFKALLQIFLQKKGLQAPVYLVVKEWGPGHQKTFHVVVALEDHVLGEGEGPSKKMAEIHAAKTAYEKLLKEEKI